ncbi:OmpA family protein [Pullulanibacillus sp. KACC 23026]|uniref:OmpA family protein n=1 Tax=Pullulanibacillus sp. KACC 23026 TaxID=3028315 RepID=UPI0023B1CFD2|nr:OmpA family protein [Pullulanibacillus sp. KACC 23026]WEG11271.1 OmpA family protein [Pullulanibacillus sp. KACC 23026]
MIRRLKKLEEDEQEEHIDESWLIPYADILTLLLALFIVLFASSSINISKYNAIMKSLKSELTGTKVDTKTAGLTVKNTQKSQKQPPKQPVTHPKSAPPKSANNDQDLENLKQKLETYIKKNHLQAVITLGDTQRGVEVTLKDYILFDSGKANLKPSSYKTLSAIVGLLNTVSNPISIEGHTDNVPIKNSEFKSNWELSAARAASVLHFFESKNIADQRMQFTGYGQFKPLYKNDTNKHRQANRRVNIVILRNN